MNPAQVAMLSSLLDSWGIAPDRKQAVLTAATGEALPPASVPLRLFKMGKAADETGLSRQTLWRAIKAGRLTAVEIRPGSFRIPENALRRFVGAA